MLNGAFLKSLSILRFCYDNQIQTNIKDQDKMLQYVAFSRSALFVEIKHTYHCIKPDFILFFFKFHAVANL